MDEEQNRMEKKLQAVSDKYDALINKNKEEDEVEEDRKRFEEKVRAIFDKYDALIKEIKEQ
ncbi:hypothetical protein [Sporosarcina koreensis]|uniref:Uncharacterized protein n=1 Tax=Sporosarcina koreensis TaxID=334735 RepID=A0ABW0U1B1_9BACL